MNPAIETHGAIISVQAQNRSVVSCVWFCSANAFDPLSCSWQDIANADNTLPTRAHCRTAASCVRDAVTHDDTLLAPLSFLTVPVTSLTVLTSETLRTSSTILSSPTELTSLTLADTGMSFRSQLTAAFVWCFPALMGGTTAGFTCALLLLPPALLFA
eukprot:566570-Rhodomonas_salina.1